MSVKRPVNLGRTIAAGVATVFSSSSKIGGGEGFAHLLRVLDGKVEDAELKARFGDFQLDYFDLECVNRSFGVDGPRHVVQKAFEPSKTKKPIYTKQNDPFYRLGQKLKMLSQSDVE